MLNNAHAHAHQRSQLAGTATTASCARTAAHPLMRVGVPRRRSSGSAPPSSLPADRSYTGGSAIVGTARFRPADRLRKLRRTAAHPLMRVEVPRPEKLRLSSETGVARSLSFERRSPTPLWLAGAALAGRWKIGSEPVVCATRLRRFAHTSSPAFAASPLKREKRVYPMRLQLIPGRLP